MAETIKLGNNNWATKEGNMLAYNDENGNFKPIELDFARSSSATVLKRNGLIADVAINEPRVSFEDSVNGAFKLEPQRTNVLTYSNDFTNADWAKLGVTIDSNSTQSPTALIDADSLIEDSSLASQHFVEETKNITNGVDYSVSCFIKYNSKQWVRLFASGLNANVYFDVLNGVIGSSSNALNIKIKDYGGGWFRCSFSSTSIATTTTFKVSLADNDGVVVYDGDGVSFNYISQTQLELGTFATSTIPTTGTAITRAAESASKTGLESYINSSEGVLFIDGSVFKDSFSKSISLNSGVNSTEIQLGYTSDVDPRVFALVRVSNSVEYIYYHNIDQSLNHLMALKWKPNDFSFFVDGVKVNSQLSGETFSANTLNVLDLSRNGGTSQFIGNIKDLRVYNTALTDLELQTLTTI